MPSAAPVLRTLVETAETLIIALAGGAAFTLIGFPAGLVSGSVLAVAAAALLGRPVEVPVPLARACYVLIGILLGAVVTPQTLKGLATWPVSIALVMIAALGMMLATATYLRVVHRWDRLSALMGASPGAMSQVIALSSELGADLPAFTQMVVNLSKFVQTKGWMILVVAGGAGWVFFYFKKRSRAMREWIDRTLLKLPVVGPILVKAAIARYARTLATTFAAGVPLVEALNSVAGATGNIVYETGVLRMKDEVATGQRLQRAMENTGLFPNMVNQMIAVGEESGSLDQMASKVADFYELEVDAAVDSMSSLLEPLIMAILGVLVGGLVVAMYLPIFKLGSVV